MGLMKVEFNNEMNTNMTLSYLNSSLIDIYVTPAFNDEVSQNRNYNFTWKAISFKNKTLEIKLNFTSPLDISASIDQYDSITFHIINNTDIFVSTGGKILNKNSKTLQSKIKKQMF